MRPCSEQLKLYVRERACYCFGCLEEKFDECENEEWVDPWKEIQIEREPSGALTRSTADAGDVEHSINLSELADKRGVVAVATEDIEYNMTITS